MAEQTTLQAIGLQTSPNELGSVPAGGLVKAENCVMLAPGVVASRRGQESIGYAPSAAPNALAIYDDTLIAQVGASTLQRDTGSAFTSYSGSYTPRGDYRMKFLTAQGNLYFTTTTGVYRLDSTTVTPALAGVPVALDISGIAVGSDAGFLADGSSVAYRVAIGYKDLQGNLHLGAPSGRYAYTNSSGGAKNLSVTFPLPSTVTIDHFWQLYRTNTFASGTTPGDEMRLVQEAYFTSAQVSALAVTVTDTSPDGFLGAWLYTNEINGQGILQANDPPPLCSDLAWWDQRAWYADTQQPQSMTLQILGCGFGQDGRTGIRPNDSLTLGSESYIAGTSVSSLGGGDYTYDLETALDADVNVQNTALSLVKAINTYSASYRASYQSPADGDPPGIIQITGRTLTTSAFRASAQSIDVDVNAGQMSRSFNTVTINTATEHGFDVDDTFYLSGSGGMSGISAGTYTVATVPTSTQFTFTESGSNDTSVSAVTVRRVTPQAGLAWSPNLPIAYFSLPAGNLSRTGSTVTATVGVKSASALVPGVSVVIEPTSTPDADFAAGTFTVATVDDIGGAFTYSQAGSAVTSDYAYRSGARVTSDPQEAPERVYYSKLQQPEAVPQNGSALPTGGGYVPVGTKGKPVRRIVALGDALYCFKDEGIWIISGQAPYRVDLLDDTVKIVAPDSAVVVSGRIYALTNQGVVAVSNTGAQIVSGPIEQDLFQYFGPTLADVKTDAFGVSHETDRLYTLWMPALSGASSAPYNVRRAYVYSTLARAWTTWELVRNCGIVNSSDDTLYMGGTTAAIYTGRNTKKALDYSDAQSALLTTGYDSTTRTISVVSSSGVSIGDAIYSTTPGIVTSVPSSTSIVVSGGSGFGNQPQYQASGSVDLSASFEPGGDVGVIIGGVTVTVPYTGDHAADAASLMDAVNDDPSASAIVTAEMSEVYPETVFFGAVFPTYTGTLGNAITLVAVGTGVTVSGSTLTGGQDINVVFKAIPCALKWRTFTDGSAADEKQWNEGHLHFRERSFYSGTVALTTDIQTTEQTVDIIPGEATDGTIASFAADPNLYPGMPVEPKKSRFDVPQEVGRSAYLNLEWDITEAFAVWWLNGVTLSYERVSDRSQR